MKDASVASSICEPEEVYEEADHIIAIVKSLPAGASLRKSVAVALSNMANSGEVTVWAGIDAFLKAIVDSGQCREDLLPGVTAVQAMISESYADVLAAIRKKMDEAGAPLDAVRPVSRFRKDLQ